MSPVENIVDGVLARAPHPKVVLLPVPPRPRHSLVARAASVIRGCVEALGWLAVCGFLNAL
jgi:hypothetical protein